MIVVAVSALAATLLASVDVSAPVAAVALELALAGMSATASEQRRSTCLALAATLFAAWTAPRLAPPLLVPIVAMLAQRRRTDRVGQGALAYALPPFAAAVTLLVVRSSIAWLATGRAWIDGAFAKDAGALVAEGGIRRAAIVTATCAGMAIVVAATNKKLARVDLVAALSSVALLATALVLRARGGAIVAIVVLLPTAASSIGALHLAVERFVIRERAGAPRGRISPYRAVAWLVPALALGWSARAFEDELRDRRVSADAAAAASIAAIETLGLAPPRAMLVIDDEPTLLRWAHARITLGLRPDVRALPTHSLLLGGAARIAARTTNEVPEADGLEHALLANGRLEESDVAPLQGRVALLSALPATRVRPLARHVDATGDALLLPLERVDPSDRRARRPALEKRLRFVVWALAERPLDDDLRRSLRVAATREARLLSAAGDRDGALSALARAGALGAEPERIAGWITMVKARQSIADLPPCEDD